MSTHADSLAAAERAVVDAAESFAQIDKIYYTDDALHSEWENRLIAMHRAIDNKNALRAQTCPECLGDGRKHTYDANGQPQPWIEDHGVCPACSGTGERK